ncbi:ornithine cyclodeaminase family protein [Nocardiopsis ganjiahuensis]|uniref:ornithine cyclodeaminase family protein n=1 Tax=Nocardiopsis ganjiahuensis TaxID=239984 RepID=UPI00034BF789|nr:ornithine cyclodeaminase family protein [Nocardiopsis ganjiahuensis]
MTLILTRSELAGLVTPNQVAEAVETAFADLAAGRAAQPHSEPARIGLSDPQFVPMVGLLGSGGPGSDGLVASKLLSDIPGNRERGLPTQQSVLVLSDAVTGGPLAVLDGAVPTRLRTAAATRVATRHLARRGWDSLGILGAGPLAVAHVVALAEERELDRVLVWSRSAATVEALRESVDREAPGLKVVPAASPREVVEGADVVCTVTPSREPLVQGEWLRPGQHLNVVGSPPRTDHREVDAATLAVARDSGLLVVDSTPAALHESGDVAHAIAEGAITAEDCSLELARVVGGRHPGRTSDTQITVFNSVGIGLEDAAVGRLLLDAARERGLGTEISLAG